MHHSPDTALIGTTAHSFNGQNHQLCNDYYYPHIQIIISSITLNYCVAVNESRERYVIWSLETNVFQSFTFIAYLFGIHEEDKGLSSVVFQPIC